MVKEWGRTTENETMVGKRKGQDRGKRKIKMKKAAVEREGKESAGRESK